jgi:hypothetical protein
VSTFPTCSPSFKNTPFIFTCDVMTTGSSSTSLPLRIAGLAIRDDFARLRCMIF